MKAKMKIILMARGRSKMGEDCEIRDKEVYESFTCRRSEHPLIFR